MTTNLDKERLWERDEEERRRELNGTDIKRWRTNPNEPQA